MVTSMRCARREWVKVVDMKAFVVLESFERRKQGFRGSHGSRQTSIEMTKRMYRNYWVQSEIAQAIYCIASLQMNEHRSQACLRVETCLSVLVAVAEGAALASIDLVRLALLAEAALVESASNIGYQVLPEQS